MFMYTDRHKVPFQIDEEYEEAVSHYSWALSMGYPATTIGKRPTRKRLRLHWFLFGRAPKGLMWDHINRNRLDNRRENLRLVTSQVNIRNTRLSPKNLTGCKGVRWVAGRKKFSAHIMVSGKRHFLGEFLLLEDAIKARKAAELELW